MLKSLFQKIIFLFQIYKFKRSKIYRVACLSFENQRETYADFWEGVSQETKNVLTIQLMQQVHEIHLSNNRILKNRELIVKCLFDMAPYQLVVLDLRDIRLGDDSFYDYFIKKQGITGELRSHISEIAEKNQVISRLVEDCKCTSDEDVISACSSMVYKYLIMVNVFNTLRVLLGDTDPNERIQDWFRPLSMSILARVEDDMRAEIGLSSTSDEDNTEYKYDSVEYICDSTLVKLVLNGAVDPIGDIAKTLNPQD